MYRIKASPQRINEVRVLLQLIYSYVRTIKMTVIPGTLIYKDPQFPSIVHEILA